MLFCVTVSPGAMNLVFCSFKFLRFPFMPRSVLPYIQVEGLVEHLCWWHWYGLILQLISPGYNSNSFLCVSFLSFHQTWRWLDCNTFCPGMYSADPGLLSLPLPWAQFLSVASEPALRLPLFLIIRILVLPGPRQLAKCEKQLYCTDKPSWNIQQVSMDVLWSYESLP